MSEWQPIKTAPNDGKNILVFGGYFTEVTIWRAEGEWWNYMLKTNATVPIPTHWMPLPAPPQPHTPKEKRDEQ